MKNLLQAARRQRPTPSLLLALFFSVIFSGYIHALDNPDIADYVEEFQARMLTFEKESTVENAVGRESVDYYHQYLSILDIELNNAYTKTLAALPKDAKEQLRASQRNWVAFRDTEFAFIGQHWTRADFGSSYFISSSEYKIGILKSRIVQLLGYLKGA